MNIESIKNDLAHSGYCSVSDDYFKKIATAARQEYYQLMNTLPAHAPKSRLDPKTLKDSPWKKLAIGSTTGLGESYAQLLQTTYFAENDARYPALRDIFANLITLRNTILDVQKDFGSHPERDDFWNACRVHHYPRGGGFMAGHRDTYFPNVLGKAGQPFLQVMLLLSERGTDFHTGGGYIVDKQGQQIFYEDSGSLGNFVCFDGSIVHGVADVDGDQVLDFSKQSGRMAVFVGLYKVLKQN